MSYTQHIPALGWTYNQDRRSFVMDVSYGVTEQTHGADIYWTKELHLTHQPDGTWRLRSVTTNAPSFDAPLVSTYVHADTVVSTNEVDILAQLDAGFEVARDIQHGLDDEAVAS